MIKNNLKLIRFQLVAKANFRLFIYFYLFFCFISINENYFTKTSLIFLVQLTMPTLKNRLNIKQKNKQNIISFFPLFDFALKYIPRCS